MRSWLNFLGLDLLSKQTTPEQSIAQLKDSDLLPPPAIEFLKEQWDSDFVNLLNNKLESSPSDYSSYTPKSNLNVKVSDDDALYLNEFPEYRVRVKTPYELGTDDPHVPQLSGYLDVLNEDKHFFFWVHASRNDVENDPLVLWLNGGPGCSSSTGQFFELGPGFVNSSLQIESNPNAWNNNATVIFLDQPVNVGYSYSTKKVDNTKAAAKDVYAFLEIFFNHFVQGKNTDFHIAGESYAGMYLPAIGREILSHKDRSFNLTSALIGNPITDPALQAFSSVAMACGDGGYPSVLDDETCSSLYAKVPTCESLINKCYETKYNKLVCSVAELYCSSLDAPYIETGRNVYDISQVCGDNCYPETKDIDAYLRLPEVINAVGSDVDDFVGCSNNVGVDFASTLDGLKNEGPDVLYLLEHGVDLLFYDGAYDWICSWPGVYRLVERLRYEHHAEFVAKPVTPFIVDGEVAGETKSVGHLSWLKVYEAGHMVPHDKGRQASEMLNRWLVNRQLQ